jgi:hypothetical protein
MCFAVYMTYSVCWCVGQMTEWMNEWTSPYPVPDKPSPHLPIVLLWHVN